MFFYKFLKFTRSRLFYTVVVALMLSLTFLFMVDSIYKTAEEEGYDYLHLETKQIKDDIKLQMVSDQENLITMSRFAAKLHADGEGYELLFDSFKSIGLIKNIGILLPDNTFITKVGKIDLTGVVSFEKEAAKGRYISGREDDFTNKERKVVRISAPIISKGKTVALLYGVTDVGDLKQRYMQITESNEAQLYVFESASGELIIDTFHNTLGNISSISDREYKDNFSYEKVIDAVSKSESGYASFVSRTLNEDLYVHFAPLDVGDWYIMLAQPKRIVFKDAKYIEGVLLEMFALIIVIMLAYLLLIYSSERKQTKLNEHASETRKLLIGINQHNASIVSALENIAHFARAHSAFFVDSDGDDYSYVAPEYKQTMLKDEDRKYFFNELMSIVGKNESGNCVDVRLCEIKQNAQLAKDNPKFFVFMKKHSVRNISVASIIDKSGNVELLSTINAKNVLHTRELLQKIIVCFSIALFNQKHLNRTEIAATTDSLTGLANRVQYKNDILRFDEERPLNFACIYVDVNELHIYNNKFGHAAGDAMLRYTANILKEVFFCANIYRIGGDEFVVFLTGTTEEFLKDAIADARHRLAAMNYYISAGYSFRTVNDGVEEIVKEAETRMYADKSLYYQTKQANYDGTFKEEFKHLNTGIEELDKCLSIMSNHYYGIYRVSLSTDKVRRILMPAYLEYGESEENFKHIFTKYVNENANPDFHRALLSFLNYDVIIKQHADGKIPKVNYLKTDGNAVVLSVYPLASDGVMSDKTLWIFEKA